MGNKSDQSSSQNTSDSVGVEPVQSKPPEDKPKTEIVSGISLGDFLANSKEQSVRKASNYIYVGFRRHCTLKKFQYRASNKEWLDRFKAYISMEVK